MTAEQKARLDEAVWVSPQRMSGTPCFRGTRVPVQSLIDFLEGGETIDQFLALYPGITRQQVVAVLQWNRAGMTLDNYEVVFYRNQPDGWVAEVPAIPGCYALMTTREEALAELEGVFHMITAEYQGWHECDARNNDAWYFMLNSAEEFIRLRTSDTPADYLRAASDDAPLEVWEDIINRHPGMRSWVAQNKTVPLEILTILARDPSADVRHSVAMKNKLSPEILLELAEDEDESVRRRIAYNKNASVEVLRKLAMDRSQDVAEIAKTRLANANNPA